MLIELHWDTPLAHNVKAIVCLEDEKTTINNHTVVTLCLGPEGLHSVKNKRETVSWNNNQLYPPWRLKPPKTCLKTKKKKKKKKKGSNGINNTRKLLVLLVNFFCYCSNYTHLADEVYLRSSSWIMKHCSRENLFVLHAQTTDLALVSFRFRQHNSNTVGHIAQLHVLSAPIPTFKTNIYDWLLVFTVTAIQ